MKGNIKVSDQADTCLNYLIWTKLNPVLFFSNNYESGESTMKKIQIAIMCICLLVICFALSGCKKKSGGSDVMNQSEDSPTVTPTQTIEETAETDTAESQTDSETTEEETGSNSDDEVAISSTEAIQMILDEIGDTGYTIELLNEEFTFEKNKYYLYQVFDGATKIEPKLIVDKKTKEILCYKLDETTASFQEFPLYTDQADTSENSVNEFTKEDALDQLTKLSAKELGLPAKLKGYSIVFDDWTTNVNGVDCYGINAYSKVDGKFVNMGLFYVATDGSVMYKFDSQLDDFVQIFDQ